MPTLDVQGNPHVYDTRARRYPPRCHRRRAVRVALIPTSAHDPADALSHRPWRARRPRHPRRRNIARSPKGLFRLPTVRVTLFLLQYGITDSVEILLPRRLVAGAVARSLGHGGKSRVAAASGLSRNTVIKGQAEVEAGVEPSDRLRAPGAGDKKAIDKQPGLLAALDELGHLDVAVAVDVEIDLRTGPRTDRARLPGVG